MRLRVTRQFAANCHLFSWGGMHSCKTNMMQLFVDVDYSGIGRPSAEPKTLTAVLMQRQQEHNVRRRHW